MQAPKNGFFYVLDRETGELISAEQLRPRELGGGHRCRERSTDSEPERRLRERAGAGHAHVPRRAQLAAHVLQPGDRAGLHPGPGDGRSVPARSRLRGASGRVQHGRRQPPLGTFFDREAVSGYLLAWDPVEQKEVWRHPYGLPWNGGTLTTAGNLVFQGTADGRFLALRADDGTPAVAEPLGGHRHHRRAHQLPGGRGAVRVGGGGLGRGLRAGRRRRRPRGGRRSSGRILAWALVDETITPDVVDAMLESRDPAAARGADLYHELVLALSRCERHRGRRESGPAEPRGGARGGLRAHRLEWPRRHLDARLLPVALAGRDPHDPGLPGLAVRSR